jgi:hypothetical protein
VHRAAVPIKQKGFASEALLRKHENWRRQKKGVIAKGSYGEAVAY